MIGKEQVRVLLVDDSPLALAMLKRVLDADPRLEVIGTASDGINALEAVKTLSPDVVCTDFHMPRMNGLELTRRLMETTPLPILVVSVSVQDDQTQNIYDMLRAGAVDVFAKPRGAATLTPTAAKAFCDSVYFVSGVKVQTRQSRPRSRLSNERVTDMQPRKAPEYASERAFKKTPKIVAIGGSTGAPRVYATILPKLGSHFPAPIVCVQHISEGFAESLVSWLDQMNGMSVKIAADGERLLPGVAYFPPEKSHLIVRSGRVFCKTEEPRRNGHRPSVDVLFESLLQAYDPHSVIAVLLSGMGRDGAEGLAALHANGAHTIAQSAETCAVFGMPNEANKLGGVDRFLDPDQIAPALIRAFQKVPTTG